MMKTKIFLTGLLLTAALQPASAHTQAGSLGTAEGATDFYQVTCTDDGNGAPALLQTHVLSGLTAANPPTTTTPMQISVQSTKGQLATNSTDTISNDGKYSTSVSLSGGAGAYAVTVDKNQATTNAKVYTVEFHCMTSTGLHTGTDSATLQSQ